MSSPVRRKDHQPSIQKMLRLAGEIRGSEMHPGEPEIQQLYDNFLNAAELAKSGLNEDLVGMGTAYTAYAKAAGQGEDQ